MVLAVLAVIDRHRRVNIAVVLVAMFLLGTAEVFADTTTSTLLPMVVGKRDLGIGNARIMAGDDHANQLVGPPIGAALFAAGTAWPFVVQAVCVALGAGLVSRMVTATAAPRRRRPSHVGQRHPRGLALDWGHAAGAHPGARRSSRSTSPAAPPGRCWCSTRSSGSGMGAVGLRPAHHASAPSAAWSAPRRTTGSSGASASATIMRVGLVIETLHPPGLAADHPGWVALVIMFVFGAHAFVWGTTSRTVRQRAVPIAAAGPGGQRLLVGVYRRAGGRAGARRA